MKDQRGGPLKRIKPADQMSDENFMKHLELRHPHELKVKFTIEPGFKERRMRARSAWEAYHEAIHRIETSQNNHWHGEQDDE